MSQKVFLFEFKFKIGEEKNIYAFRVLADSVEQVVGVLTDCAFPVPSEIEERPVEYYGRHVSLLDTIDSLPARIAGVYSNMTAATVRLAKTDATLWLSKWPEPVQSDK